MAEGIVAVAQRRQQKYHLRVTILSVIEFLSGMYGFMVIRATETIIISVIFKKCLAFLAMIMCPRLSNGSLGLIYISKILSPLKVILSTFTLLKNTFSISVLL